MATIRDNRLKGADKLLKNKKELETEGRGSSDFCVDANRNIIVVRWLDNCIVQLISNYIRNPEGSPARRWSVQKKKFIEIPRPMIVEQYNLHMGGVDLCDVLMSLYRIHLRSAKFYMHIAHYCIIFSVAKWMAIVSKILRPERCASKTTDEPPEFPVSTCNSIAVCRQSREVRGQRGGDLLSLLHKKENKEPCNAITNK